jgi:hypothetical protein
MPQPLLYLTPSIFLGNVCLCGTALDRAFLLASDGARFLQCVGQVRYAAHELAMITDIVRALYNQVGDCAARWEPCIGDTRITAVNNDCGA